MSKRSAFCFINNSACQHCRFYYRICVHGRHWPRSPPFRPPLGVAVKKQTKKKSKAKCITIRSELRETRCKLDSDRCQATRRSCQIRKKESGGKKRTVLEGHSQICNLAVIELTGESERILYPSHRLRDILKRDIEPHTETRRQDKNETP